MSTATATAPTKFEQRQAEALDAAAEIFARKGYHATSTTDIAERLNIKQGSLYYYFPSKEAALEAVCLKGITWFNSHLQEFVDDEQASFAQIIDGIIDLMMEMIDDYGDYLTVFHTDHRCIPDQRRAKAIAKHEAVYRAHYNTLFSRAQERGEIGTHWDIETAVRAFTGLMTSITAWYLVDPNINRAAIKQHYSAIFLQGVCKA